MSGDENFTPIERARLERLKTRYAAGAWPAQAQVPFEVRHEISMHIERIHTGADTETYLCRLARSDGDTVIATLETMFQVTRGFPEPPGTAEVLRWLATSAAHLTATNDLGAWARLFLATAKPIDGRPPYRGLVRGQEALNDFSTSLSREAARLREFLGEAAFQELLTSVDAV